MLELTTKCSACAGTGKYKADSPYSYSNQCNECYGKGEFLTEFGREVIRVVVEHGKVQLKDIEW